MRSTASRTASRFCPPESLSVPGSPLWDRIVINKTGVYWDFRPIQNGFENRHETAAVEAGQTHVVARWETQRTHRRAESARDEREPSRRADRADPEPAQHTHAPEQQRVGDAERGGPSAANGRTVVIGGNAPMPASAPAPAAGSSQSQSREAPSRSNDAAAR